MAELRVSPEVEAELDDIWLYLARESASIDVANRVIDRITERFWLLAQYPYLGHARDEDLRPGLRSFPVDGYIIVHRVEADDVVLILHVVPPGRDIGTLIGR
jgi:toxin ParE1/3/4